MKPIYKLILAVCFLLSYNIALGQSVQGLPSPAFHWKCASADSLLNFQPATLSGKSTLWVKLITATHTTG